MLNASLQDIEDYKKRLNAIVSSETFFRSNNRALEHHMASQASTILNTLTSRRERFGTSQEGIITMLTLKFFQDGPGKNFLNDLMESSMTWGERGKRFTIATIIVEQELARYLHDNQKMNAYTQKEMGDKEFQRVYNELLAVVEKNVFETKNWNDLFLDSTLNESISEIFNITKLSYKLSPRAMKKENDPNKAARAMMESLGLTEILKNDILTNSVAHIKVQPQSQAVALYAEIASLIRSNIKSRGAHIGGKSAAVDLVRLIISPEKENETVNKSVNTFLKALKNFKFNTDEDDNHA